MNDSTPGVKDISNKTSLSKKTPGKLVLSDTTNEIIDAINGNNPGISHGAIQSLRHGGVLVPVKLVLLSGSDGSVSTEPAYKYTVKDLVTEELIVDNKAPVHQRKVGKTRPATIGLLWPFWYNVTNQDCALFWTDEVPLTGPCSTPP